MNFIKASVKTGVFILVSIIILAFSSYKIGNKTWEKQREYIVLFKHIDDLSKSATVTYAGLAIGKVADLYLLTAKERVVAERIIGVKIQVKSDVIIREEDKVIIKTIGFMGQKYLDIQPGDIAAKVMKPGSTLLGEEPMDLNWIIEKFGYEIDSIVEEVHEILDQMKTSIEDFQVVIQDVKDKQLVQNILIEGQDVVAKMDRIASSMEEIIDNNSDKVNDIVDAFHVFSSDLKQNLKTCSKLVKESLSSLKDFLKRLDPIVNNMDQIIAEFKPKFVLIIENTNDITKNIKEFSLNVKKNPWILLSKPRKGKKDIKERRR